MRTRHVLSLMKALTKSSSLITRDLGKSPQRLDRGSVFSRRRSRVAESLRNKHFQERGCLEAGRAMDYSKWSNAQLIARVTELEESLRGKNEVFHAKSASIEQLRLSTTKPKREFDPTRYTARRIALKFAYLGQRYNGFEYHANNPTPLPTIEEELWKALMKTKLIFPTSTTEMTWDGCDYSKCGRTDKGVSAFGQVVGLTVRSNRPKSLEASDSDSSESYPIENELSYPRILNRVLPEDIRILAWCPAPTDDFSARFSCIERRYKYFFTQPAFCPLPEKKGRFQRHDGRVNQDGWLDIEAMRTAAQHYVGLHDFRNFCKVDASKQITDFSRRITHVDIEEASSCSTGVSFASRTAGNDVGQHNEPLKVYTFTVHGSAFLWHQVRHLVAMLFLVGQGFEDASIVKTLLDIKAMPNKPMYEMADDAPLVLWDCIFPEQSDSGETFNATGLSWIYADGQTSGEDRKQAFSSSGDGRHGPGGVQEVLWAGWRRRKIEEVLAGSLLDMVAQQKRSDAIENGPEFRDADRTSRLGQSARVFEGDNLPRLKGVYTPILERARMESPEVLNERYRKRKGMESNEQ